MKTTAFIILLNFVFILSGRAQGKYSNQSLEQLSREDLELYLEKAQKQKKAGAILSIAGPVTAVSGLLLASLAYGSGTARQFSVGLFMMGIGPVATVVGLPLLITGSARVKRIDGIRSGLFNGVSMELAPCVINNYQLHTQQPGVTLRIRF